MRALRHPCARADARPFPILRRDEHMETWSFYSAGIRIARFWPAAGTLEWACLDDGAGVLGARGAMNEENAEWFARRYQFSPAAFFEGLSAWNEAFAGGGSPVAAAARATTAVRMDLRPARGAFSQGYFVRGRRCSRSALFKRQRNHGAGAGRLGGTHARGRVACLCACGAGMPVRALGTFWCPRGMG